MPNKTYSAEKKLEIIQAIEEYGSVYHLASIYSVHHSTILEWKHKYDQHGFEGLKVPSACKMYSKEFKLETIQLYLTGEYSIREIARMRELSDASVLRGWIKKYNSRSDIKDSPKGRKIPMTNRQKTTWEERVQIVLYYLGNGKNYREVAETFNVSYRQVYGWVKKYEVGGEEALKDRRSAKKSEASMTPEEKVALQIKRLERDNERLRAENLFLKKLEEIERRRK